MLEFQSVCAGYGSTQVLHDLSLAFPRGQISLLLGPNGCGKSTLLRVADGLLPPSGGRVLLNGVPLDQIPRRELARQVAYLPQSRGVGAITARALVLHGRFPYLSYPRRYRKEDYETADLAMEWTGVSHLAARLLAQLSGGRRQKVYLAMALSQDTPVILLDEPTTYLDIGTQYETLRLVRMLNRQYGLTVLMVLHDLNQAARFSQKILAMREGRLVGEGSVEQVISADVLREVFQVTGAIFPDPITGTPIFVPES